MATKKRIYLLSLIIFFVLSGFILIKFYNHYSKIDFLIEKETMRQSEIEDPASFSDSLISEVDLEFIKSEKDFILSHEAFISFVFYFPGALIAVIFSFILAVFAKFYINTKRSRISLLIIQLLDSVPLIFWVFLALAILYSLISNQEWGHLLEWAYYPALSVSYGAVLIVIFFFQDVQKIAEINSTNIIDGEKVTGISNGRIVFRMLWYQFLKAIFPKQFFYAILYLVLFDYCFMYIFNDYLLIGDAWTTISLKAGLYYHRAVYYSLLEWESMASLYQELHYAGFYMIVFVTIVFYSILFWCYDLKELFDD
ncbi:membrane hypothetical protein [Candidatus Magnetomoraceae bacterium gMMP-1]